MATLDMTEKDTRVQEQNGSTRKLDELSRLYLRGDIDMNSYQAEIDNLGIQLDFRKLAERRHSGMIRRASLQLRKIFSSRD